MSSDDSSSGYSDDDSAVPLLSVWKFEKMWANYIRSLRDSLQIKQRRLDAYRAKLANLYGENIEHFGVSNVFTQIEDFISRKHRVGKAVAPHASNLAKTLGHPKSADFFASIFTVLDLEREHMEDGHVRMLARYVGYEPYKQQVEANNRSHNVSSLMLRGTCGACGTVGTLLSCGGCNKATYCDAQCQASDWPTHQNKCKREKAVYSSLT